MPTPGRHPLQTGGRRSAALIGVLLMSLPMPIGIQEQPSMTRHPSKYSLVGFWLPCPKPFSQASPNSSDDSLVVFALDAEACLAYPSAGKEELTSLEQARYAFLHVIVEFEPLR